MVLLLGRNGYVAKRFIDFFKFKNIKYESVSLKDSPPYTLGMYLKHLSPRFVINAMGYTGVPNVDACEDSKKECLYANVVLAEIVADECRKKNIPLGFVSSGCIYNEDKIEWWRTYKEKDWPNFSFYNTQDECSWYSGTKALGERLVRKSWDRTRIFRLRMPFNHINEPKNYLTKIFSYDKVLSLQNSLTNIDEFVRAVYQGMNTETPYGTYNVVNHGGISAKKIHEIARKYNLGKENYEYFENLEEFNKVVRTPRSNCVLDSGKIRTEGIYMLPVEESIEECFKSWNQPERKIFW
jgi:dTDP-4-dehydrorhamnose reductase